MYTTFCCYYLVTFFILTLHAHRSASCGAAHGAAAAVAAAQGSRVSPLQLRTTTARRFVGGACSSSVSSSRSRTCALRVRAADDRAPPGGGPGKPGGAALASRFNPVYAAIFGAYAALLLLHNPYIYAGLTIASVLPQNSNVTSLNNLVLLFYESGLFMNFAEAVTCVRLVTWLSIGFMVVSFALFR